MTLDTAWRQHLPSLKTVIETHDLRARKSLGQNFIMDPAITDRIASAAGDLSGQRVIEIGPGPGGLTRSLLSTNAESVLAIEFDPRAIAALSGLRDAAGGRLTIQHGDALQTDWKTLLAGHAHNVIIANLPYNISTVLLVQWLQCLAEVPGSIDQMILMFQREVADRLTSPVSTPDYGRLSVLTQWICEAQNIITLPPGAFVPAPKVYSCVVRFTPRSKMAPVTWKTLDTLLHAAFLHRRKMLRTNLKSYLSLLAEEGIADTTRAQDVSVDQYLSLAQRIEAH